MKILEAIKLQKLGLAGALTAAILLIAVFRAPKVPVIAGCLAALCLLVIRSAAKAESGK